MFQSLRKDLDASGKACQEGNFAAAAAAMARMKQSFDAYAEPTHAQWAKDRSDHSEKVKVAHAKHEAEANVRRAHVQRIKLNEHSSGKSNPKSTTECLGHLQHISDEMKENRFPGPVVQQLSPLFQDVVKACEAGKLTEATVALNKVAAAVSKQASEKQKVAKP